MPSKKKQPHPGQANRSDSGKRPSPGLVARRFPEGSGVKGEKPQQASRDWQQIFDIVPHFVALLSPDLKVVRLNRAACEKLGKKSQDVAGERCCEIVHGSHDPIHDCPCVECMRTGKPAFSELIIEESHYVATASPVLGENGELIGLVHTMRDITERKRQDQELWSYRDQLEELVKERTVELRTANEQLQGEIAERKRADEKIERSYHIQSVLNELLSLSLEDISLEEILERAIDHIVSIPRLALQFRGGIFMVEEEPEVLVMKAQRGLASSLKTTCARIPFGKCLCGRAAESGKIQFANGVDERHGIRYREMVAHGHYCVPIMSSDRRTLGVFTLYLKEDHPRDGKEEEFLGAVANVLAGIIERRRAEETIKETAEQLKIEREALERKNIALGEIMDRVESEKNALKQQLVTNVEQAVIPTLLRLKKSSKPFQKRIFEMLEKDLREVVSPFIDTLRRDHAKLSPREMEVSRLIRNGMTSKEIAEVLNLSLLTVYKYRDLIRKKLGLVNQGTNLRTHLRSF
jgi:PAS domain S-box-containing protein